MDYFINYECNDSPHDVPHIQPIVEDGHSLEDAFDLAAKLEADSFLESGQNDGCFALVPNFRECPRVDFSR